MRDVSPESPEARRVHPDAHPHRKGFFGHIGPGSQVFEFARRAVVGVYNDGFIHAGNLAYLTLLAMFPFFIILAAAAQLLGRPEENLAALHSIARAFPPSVGDMVESTAVKVLSLRTGPLLWFGAAIGVWTVGSFIETIREILRRAYGTEYARPFWQYRLIGVAIIVVAVGLLITAFSMQVLLTGNILPSEFEDVIGVGKDVFEEQILIEGADSLAPLYFEAMIAALWKKRGFKSVKLTPASGDGGVDVVAKTVNVGELIQVKHSVSETGSLGWDAVKEIVSGERL